MLLTPFITPGIGGYATGAVVFDGSNDYLTRGANPTGLLDGKKGIISFWVNFQGGDGVQCSFIENFSAFFAIRKLNTNKWQFSGANSSSSSIFVMRSNSSYTSASGWIHVLASWDLGSGVDYLYVNNSTELNSITLTNDTINYIKSPANFSLGASTAGNSKLNGYLADVYINLAEALDFSSSSNRAKFIDQTTLKPISLGSDGSLPTGTAPLFLQRLNPGSSASTFATNLGTGGDFSITGTLTTAPSSPTD